MEFIDNWRPTEKAEALEKGDLIHQMLATYYRGKKDGRTAKSSDHALLVAEAMSRARENSIGMSLSLPTVEEDVKQFKENILHWQNDGWRVLNVEEPFSKVLYRREDEVEWRVGDILVPEGTEGANRIVKREGLQILYEGIIDLVVEHPQPFGVYIVDHKTASRRSSPTKLSNQFMGYCWAKNMNQVIVNRVGFQKTLKPEERFQRIFLSYERELIKEWVQQAIYWAHVLVGYIDQNYFPPNFTSCDKYAGCIFQQVCGTIPQVRDFKLSSFYYQGEPWSPHTRDKKPEPEPEKEAENA